MAIPHYLAMTAAEMETASPLPKRAAWMACHFSPYSTGLANLPEQLPEGSLLILNDRTPIHKHDPERIAEELKTVLERFHCCGLLLDFQNPGSGETAVLARYLAETLPCPLGISREYRVDKAAVFLSDVPPTVPLEEYLKPWQGQPVWLETALEGQTITLTKNGAAFEANTVSDYLPAHADAALHCHYHIRQEENALIFHTWRTPEDLKKLLTAAEALGVTLGVGLYQELGETAIDAKVNL